MKFLFDQSTDRRLAPSLRQWGHDVTVTQWITRRRFLTMTCWPLPGESSASSLRRTETLGKLVFRHRQAHTGVIYWRLPPMELSVKIARLNALLEEHASHLDQFVVVTERSVRIRRTQQD